MYAKISHENFFLQDVRGMYFKQILTWVDFQSDELVCYCNMISMYSSIKRCKCINIIKHIYFVLCHFFPFIFITNLENILFTSTNIKFNLPVEGTSRSIFISKSWSANKSCCFFSGIFNGEIWKTKHYPFHWLS